MLRSITFKQDYRCFKEGFTLEFRPGITLLVGDQGTGKSTILQLLMMKTRDWKDKVVIDADRVEVKSFDFEMDNPRIQQYFRENVDIMVQIGSGRVSHGMFNKALLETLTQAEKVVILLDEPDQAMSPRSCYKMARIFDRVLEKGCQLVASVHNPIIISTQPEVYSLEHREWVAPEDFLESQRGPEEQKDA